MAYKNKDLSVLAYANGFTMWYYKTDDSLQDLLAENYFEPIFNLMESYDKIIYRTSDFCGDGWVRKTGKQIKIVKQSKIPA